MNTPDYTTMFEEMTPEERRIAEQIVDRLNYARRPVAVDFLPTDSHKEVVDRVHQACMAHRHERGTQPSEIRLSHSGWDTFWRAIFALGMQSPEFVPSDPQFCGIPVYRVQPPKE